jgi:hypothetical protein
MPVLAQAIEVDIKDSTAINKKPANNDTQTYTLLLFLLVFHSLLKCDIDIN